MIELGPSPQWFPLPLSSPLDMHGEDLLGNHLVCPNNHEWRARRIFPMEDTRAITNNGNGDPANFDLGLVKGDGTLANVAPSFSRLVDWPDSQHRI